MRGTLDDDGAILTPSRFWGILISFWRVSTHTNGAARLVCVRTRGLCGTCSGDALFAGAAGESDGDRIIFMSAAEPDTFVEGFGSCHDSDVCEIECEPAAGRRYEVTGTLHRTHGLLGIRVEQLREVAR